MTKLFESEFLHSNNKFQVTFFHKQNIFLRIYHFSFIKDTQEIKDTCKVVWVHNFSLISKTVMTGGEKNKTNTL